MMNVDGAGTSSARRRRERRLRSWWRHERMSVAAALAEAHHHSAPKVGAAPYNAPRSQKTARASGKLPGVLKEPEVQLEAATVGCVAASTPLLVVASLAGGDEVDATTTRYLLKCALRQRQQEEEEERRRKQREEDEELLRRAAASLSSSSGYGAVGKGSALALRCLVLVGVHCRAPLGCRRPKMLHIMAGVDQKGCWFAQGWFFLVKMPLALFSSWFSSGPGCSTSWSVWTKRTVTQFLLVTMPLALFRRDSTGAVLGQFLGPLCAMTSALVQGQFLDKCLHARLLCLTSEVGPDSTGKCGIAAVAVHRRLLTSLLHAATSPCSSRAENNRYAQCKLCIFRGDLPGAALGQGLCPLCATTGARVPDSLDTRGGPEGAAHHHGHLHPRRGAEFVPRGSDFSADHRDSTAAVLRQRDDMPVGVPHRCSTAPVAEPTVMSFTVPFGRLYHRCHCNCRGVVLSSADCPAAGVFASRCRVVVVFPSWWCSRFYLVQCEAHGWKIFRQLFPVS